MYAAEGHYAARSCYYDFEPPLVNGDDDTVTSPIHGNDVLAKVDISDVIYHHPSSFGLAIEPALSKGELPPSCFLVRNVSSSMEPSLCTMELPSKGELVLASIPTEGKMHSTQPQATPSYSTSGGAECRRS